MKTWVVVKCTSEDKLQEELNQKEKDGYTIQYVFSQQTPSEFYSFTVIASKEIL
jgi:hypothetical protein